MNVDSILICEYATLDSANTLTVVRAFSMLNATAFPARVPSLAVSAIIHAHFSEARTEHALKLILINERRETVREMLDTKFTLGSPGEHHPAGVPLRHIVIHRLINAEFKEPGAYAVEVYIDGTYHAAATFSITPPPG